MHPSNPLQPNMQFFQPNLPTQPSMVPQVTVPPHLQAKLPLFTGLVMYTLQNRCQQNPHRIFIFNLMSNNGYHNQEFQALMQFVVDLIDFNLGALRQPEQVAVTQAVEDAVTWTMAARVLQNHQFMAPWLDQQTVADFTTMANNARDVQQRMAQFQQQRQQPMYAGQAPMYGGGAQPMYPPQPMYGGAGVVGAAYAGAANAQADAAAVPHRPSAYGSMSPRTPVAAAVAAAVQTPTQPHNAGGNTHGTMGRWAAAPTLGDPTPETTQPHRPKQKISWGMPSSQPAATVAPVTPMETQQGSLPTPAPVKESRPMDRVEVNDTILMPAYQNPEFKRTWTMDSPHGLAYDPVTHLLNLTINTTTNEVGQWLAPWSEELEYMRHELDPGLREKERRRLEVMEGKKHSFTFHSVEMLKPDPQNFVSIQTDAEIPAYSEPYNLDRVEVYVAEAGEFRLVMNKVEGVKKVRDWLRQNERPGITAQAIEMYMDIPQVIYVPTMIEDGIRGMAGSQSFQELFEVMEGAASLLDEESVFALDGRCTAILNEALREGMGLGLSVDSFLGDWTELVGVMNAQYGETLLKSLEEGASDLISAGLKVLNEEAAAVYLEAIDAAYAAEVAAEAADHEEEAAEEESEPDEQDQLAGLLAEDAAEESEESEEEDVQRVVFVDRISITSLPITRDDMDLNLEAGALLTAEYLPQLHGGVQAILKRTADMPVEFRARFLMTKDGHLVKIAKSLLIKDAILLYDQSF